MILKAVTCNVKCILFSLHQYIKKTLGLTLQFKFYMYNSEKKQQRIYGSHIFLSILV